VTYNLSCTFTAIYNHIVGFYPMCHAWKISTVQLSTHHWELDVHFYDSFGIGDLTYIYNFSFLLSFTMFHDYFVISLSQTTFSLITHVLI
jgi:hypothetical protein